MLKWLIIFLAFSCTVLGQQMLEGKIVDAETGKPVAFASIGVMGTTKGTSSNLNGQFTLSVPGKVSLKISCVGYESQVVNSTVDIRLIKLKPIATQLSEIVIFDKEINARKVVRKAFASIKENYITQPFLQKFFYRHYCKDDSVYGRIVEAFVDVWKNEGYQSLQKSAGEKEEIRVTQIRRSLDRTIMAQGHEPMSIGNILQADIVGYQTREKSEHLSYFTDLSNLKTDFDSYSFLFKGITTYDGEEVYEIGYAYKKDSVLTTSGEYLQLTQISGSLFIVPDSHAIIKAEDVRRYGESVVRTSSFYRKYNGRYQPYHFIRDGENHLSDNTVHSFHIELTSVETSTELSEKFTGREPGREQLLNIPYDSAFWSTTTVLKATPLENKIISDLGGGASLNKQFYLYRQYELNVNDGGKNGAEKFNWFKQFSESRKTLYLVFWASDCKPYLADLELAKRLQKRYRNKITFVLLSLDEDESLWKQTVSKYNLYSDGIVNYRIGKDEMILKSFDVKGVPTFVLIPRNSKAFDPHVKPPSDPQLEEDFKILLNNRSE
ncbi:hypothetical protein WSM22_15750 [Cytophagales bacterium WSM2-2]|nr:hypothetical protein WSM22_15750 [Cytophagales bacterium WSM2-2]